MTLAQLAPLLDSLPLPVPTPEPTASQTAELPSHARPVALAALAAKSRRPMLVVTARQETADALIAALTQLLPSDAPPLAWSAADPLPYEQLPHDPALSARRVGVIGQLQSFQGERPLVVVSTVRALMTCIRNLESFARDSARLVVGARQDDAALLRRLIAAGYRVEPQVEGPGTVSRRGGILDITPPAPTKRCGSSSLATRSTVSVVRPLTQRSTERVREVTILPPIEYDLSARESAVAKLRGLSVESLRDEVRDEWQGCLRI